MSRVGILLEELRRSIEKHHPVKPAKIIVTGEYFKMSCEPDFRSQTMVPPGGGGLLFAGVPIESTSGSEPGFSFVIVYPEHKE